MGTSPLVFQLGYWALSFLWLAMCVLGVLAFVRVRRASFLMQGLGAGLLFLSRPVQFLMPWIAAMMDPYVTININAYQIMFVVISAPGSSWSLGGLRRR